MGNFYKYNDKVGGGVSGLTTANAGDAIADNEIIRGDGTTGIQGSAVTIADTTGTMTFPSGAEITTAGGATIDFDFGGAGKISLGGTDRELYLDGTSNSVSIRSDTQFGWSTNIGGSANQVGLDGSTAGVVKVTDGGAGAGRLMVAEGDQGNPAVHSASDTDTGIYFNGAQIGFSVNGTVQFYANTGGTHLYANGMDANGHTITGFSDLVEANVAGSGSPNVLVGSESKKVLTNEGATAENYHTLPGAVAGYAFTFIVQDADGLRVVAAGGDTIRVIDKVTAAAGYISSTTIGSTVTLVAINATEWVATSVHGVWTDGTFTYDDTGLTAP